MRGGKPKDHQKITVNAKQGRKGEPAIAQQRRTSWWTEAKREGFTALAERQTVDVKDVRHD